MDVVQLLFPESFRFDHHGMSTRLPKAALTIFARRSFEGRNKTGEGGGTGGKIAIGGLDRKVSNSG